MIRHHKDKHLTQNLYKRHDLFSYDIYRSGQYCRVRKFGANVYVVQVQVTKTQWVVGGITTSIINLGTRWGTQSAEGPDCFKSSTYFEVLWVGPTQTSCPSRHRDGPHKNVLPLKALSPVSIANCTGWTPQKRLAPQGPSCFKVQYLLQSTLDGPHKNVLLLKDQAALSPVPIAKYAARAPQKLNVRRREPNYDSSLHPARSLTTTLSRPRLHSTGRSTVGITKPGCDGRQSAQ